jgi:hypothetical protein
VVFTRIENLEKSIINEWDDSICWFCKSRQASDIDNYEVDLYRILDYKKTYAILGFQHHTKYETTQIIIPRCARCNVIHKSIFGFLFVLWLILFLAITIFSIKTWTADTTKWDLPTILGMGIGLIFMIFICALLISIAWSAFQPIVNFFWKTESYACEYPQVKNLVKQGWEEGTKPPYKRGF